MGSRAGFVIKRDGVAKAFGSRLAGSSTVSYLLRGPEQATKKFIEQGAMDEVDDVIGGEDGAAIIDWDDRVVIWMMSNCRLAVHQRLANRMIAQAFDGWTVRMAYDIYEISQQAGVDTNKYVTDDDHDVEKWKRDLQASDLSPEEIAEELLAHENHTTAEDVWQPESPPHSLRSLDEIDNPGSWVTVRRADGTLKDYFGFWSLTNCLLRGESFVQALQNLPAIDRVPHEIVTTDGLLIDEQEKVVWRWHHGRVPALDRQFAKVWPHWRFREIPGGDWAGHVELSGREPGDLACQDREILALVVAEHAPYANTNADDPGLVGIIASVRKGCLGVTAMFVIGAALIYVLSGSIGYTVAMGVLALLSLAATMVVIQKTGRVVKTLDLDLSPAESNASMDRILQGLGYPTIAELKANGEFPDADAWDEDDDEEDED